jgi:TM2 domain-containing membrane protein YozV
MSGMIVMSGRPKKDSGTAYLLWFFLGLYGAHRFYLGQNGLGLLYLFTLGLCGIGWLIDGFLIPSAVSKHNAKVDYENQQQAHVMQQMAAHQAHQQMQMMQYMLSHQNQQHR